MSMILDWTVPASLVTPEGTLTFNGSSGQRFLLDDDGGCKTTKPLRVTKDNIPQGNGNIAHNRFTEGYQIQLKVNLLVDDDPACGSDLTDMTDEIMLHLDALLDVGSGRFFFTPEGHAQRLFDQCQWSSEADPSENPYPAITFAIDTPYPYSIDYTQTTPDLDDTITNAGTADFYPVLHIDGPSSAFLVTNIALGVSIVYDSTRPGAMALGGSDYAEIDTFKNTIVLNGDVQDLDAGIDPNLSTFWWFPPGDSDTLITGATGYVLMNNCWG